MNRSALLVAALIVAACDSAPSAPVPTASTPSLAQAPGQRGPEGSPDHEHQRTAFSRVVQNPCPPVPEPVAVQGYSNFSSHFKFYDGGNSSRHHIVNHARGVGLVTGAKYVFHELYRQTGDYPYDTRVFSVEQTIRWHVISQGDGGNFFATTHQKMTCQPNGVCTIVPISFETDCRG